MDKAKTREMIFRILSVIIAFIAWMYVTNFENPEKEIVITNIPVKLINVDSLTQSNFVMIDNGSGNVVKLTIKGRSKDVNAVRPEDFKVEANLGSGYRVKGINSIPVEIKEKPSGIEIPNQPVYTDLELDELVSKSFLVGIEVTGEARAGYSNLPVSVKPSEVLLKGASRFIGSVNSVIAKVDIGDAAADINTSKPLQALDKSGKAIYGQILDKNGKPVTGDVIDITPKTVDVTIPIQRSKDVSIVVRTTGKLQSGIFKRGDITASPSRVTIIGNDSVINAINSIDTLPVNLDTVTSNVSRAVKLNIPPGVSIANNIQAVNVNIFVESMINRAFTVPVNYFNLPEGLKADLLTNNIVVTITGQESALNSLSAAEITAMVDLSTAPAEDNEYEFTPKISFPQLQDFVIKDISPPKIRVKITKKQG